ncbi:MAG: sel1 repeat family protein [Alphaproteobacteria bacterium]|nr:MAG: sel1 repeat family protein [Alphaproteobacteria bacterium]
MFRALLTLALLFPLPAAAQGFAPALSGRSAFFLMIHVVLAALAVRKICAPDAGGLAWRAIWTFIVVCTPFVGPIIFFGLADPPLRSEADRRGQGSYYRRPMGFGGAGAAGIPFLYEILAGEGGGPPPSPDLASQYREDAQKGNPRAQTCLGTLYEYGDGVDQDDKLAMDLYLRAAMQGYPAAQLLLAEMYARGRGTEKNMEEASFWLTLAVKKEPRLEPRLKELLSKIETTATFAVFKRAAEWTPISSPSAADISVPDEPGPTPKPH